MSDDVVEFRGSVMITKVRVLVGQSVAQFETLVHDVPKNDGSRFSMMASTIDEQMPKDDVSAFVRHILFPTL